VKIVSWKTFRQKMLERGQRLPNGKLLGPWRTYDTPTVYLPQSNRVIDFAKYRRP